MSKNTALSAGNILGAFLPAGFVKVNFQSCVEDFAELHYTVAFWSGFFKHKVVEHALGHFFFLYLVPSVEIRKIKRDILFLP